MPPARYPPEFPFNAPIQLDTLDAEFSQLRFSGAGACFNDKTRSISFIAGAYSACYHSALINAAERLGTQVKDSAVRVLVSLIEDDHDGYRLAVGLHANLPGIDPPQVQRIMDEAHKTCPYSKALRGDTSVKLTVD